MPTQGKKNIFPCFSICVADYHSPRPIFPFFAIGMETPTFVLGMWPTRKKIAFPSSLPTRCSHGTIFSTMAREQKRCLQLLPWVFKGQEYSSPLPSSTLLLGTQMWCKLSWPAKMRHGKRHPKESRVTRHKKAWFLDNLVKWSCLTSCGDVHAPRFKPRFVWLPSHALSFMSHIIQT